MVSLEAALATPLISFLLTIVTLSVRYYYLLGNESKTLGKSMFPLVGKQSVRFCNTQKVKMLVFVGQLSMLVC